MIVAMALAAARPATGQDVQPAGEEALARDTALVDLALHVVGHAAAIGALWPGFWSPPEFVLYRATGPSLLYSERGARPGYAPFRSVTLREPLAGNIYWLDGRDPPERREPGSRTGFVPWALEMDQHRVFSAQVLSLVDELIHESFHRWQRTAFRHTRPACVPQWYPRGMETPEGFRSAILRELHLLSDAVAGGEGSAQNGAVRAYLTARMRRLSQAAPLITYIEQEQERLEGTARFVGNAAHVVVAEGSLERLSGIMEAGLRAAVLHAQDERVADGAEQAVRSYQAGAAIVYLLHRLGPPGWQQRVADGTPLDVVLAAAVGGSDYAGWLADLPPAEEICFPGG